MGENQRKTKEQQCEPGFHLHPAFPEEMGLFHALTPEEDEALGTAGYDQSLGRRIILSERLPLPVMKKKFLLIHKSTWMLSGRSFPLCRPLASDIRP